MYESPIKIITSELQTQMESDLITKVSMTLGYKVDKEELTKALKFHRGQYIAGFNEGRAEMFEMERDFQRLKELFREYLNIQSEPKGVYYCIDNTGCPYCKWKDKCNSEYTFEWRYTDEVKKMLGEKESV